METKVEYTADEVPAALPELPEEAYAPETVDLPLNKTLETRLREAARAAYEARAQVVTAREALLSAHRLTRIRRYELERVTDIATADVYQMPEVASGKNAEIRKALADAYLVGDAHIAKARSELWQAEDQEEAQGLAVEIAQAISEEAERCYEALKLDALYQIHVAGQEPAVEEHIDWWDEHGSLTAYDVGLEEH